ncbi:MAG: helix-turn-helix domain-containing protein [Spirochaetes bacterium]|nr:helix-turn-helix domain-containing protein [Spirochaetota bacterium]
MIVIGEQLRQARESKNLDLDQVSSDTNIARRYLAALEDDNFTIFPGDPYIIGFLRNYAEHLGLDPAELVTSFKNMRIQEQPVPVAELISDRKTPIRLIVAVTALSFALVAAVAGAWFLFFAGHGRDGATAQPDKTGKPVEYALVDSSLEKRLYPGDMVIVEHSGEKQRLTLAEIAERVAIDTPVGRNLYLLGEEGSIDLDKDNTPDLNIFVSDYAKNDPSRGALIRFSRPEPARAAAVPEAGTTPASVTAVPPASETPVDPAKGVTLFAGNKSPYPFVLSATFRNYCMFRYEIDRKDRDERYYHKSDQLTVNANNVMKLWASNAASCKAIVQASGGKAADIDLGQPGVVVVKQIKWVQVENGSWSLVLYDVD